MFFTTIVVMAGAVNVSMEDQEFSEWKLMFGEKSSYIYLTLTICLLVSVSHLYTAFMNQLKINITVAYFDIRDWFFCFHFLLGKIYKSTEEEAQRKMTWLENRKLVLEHNMLAAQGIKSYTLGLNYFADMVKEKTEFMLIYVYRHTGWD